MHKSGVDFSKSVFGDKPVSKLTVLAEMIAERDITVQYCRDPFVSYVPTCRDTLFINRIIILKIDPGVCAIYIGGLPAFSVTSLYLV